MTNNLVPGDVYRLYFTNEPTEPGGKDRPGLFLGFKNEQNIWIVLKVTGKEYRDKRVKINHPLTGGIGLSKDSWAQCDWYLLLPSNVRLGTYYGRLHPQDLQRIMMRFQDLHSN